MTDLPVLSLEGVSRRFQGVAAVDNLSLAVRAGEFFSLLGPSGCGKTTTLRLIAGFDTPEPDGGIVRMLGEPVNDRRPYQRPIGMVFQNYALFPHLTVADNIAFGLQERRVPKAEQQARVRTALELVRLDPPTFARRKPSALSGGQRQRVALARALVLEPPVLLLDEPLAALDLQLRKAMQLELRELNRRLGITFILVTHDQEEALAMSDRVAVMSAGRIEQIGTPAEVYDHPRTAFVAGFIGEANLLSGVVQGCSDGIAELSGAGGQRWRVPMDSAAAGDVVQLALRPEWLTLCPADAHDAQLNSLRVTVRDRFFRGESVHVVAALPDGSALRVAVPHGANSAPIPANGDTATICWPPDAARVLQG